MDAVQKTTDAMRTLLREWHEGRLPIDALDRLLHDPQVMATHRLVVEDRRAEFIKEESCQ